MTVTIGDVAKKAGVAISTVSKVLNNYDKVSSETKDKVLCAVRELNYIPNINAAALSSKRKDVIALFIYINNLRQAIDEINMQYLFGAFNRAKETGARVITLFSSTVADLSYQEFVSHLHSLGVTSIVVFGLNKEDKIIHEAIKAQLFSIVVVDAPVVNQKTSSVSVDHMKGQYEIAKAIIDKESCKEVLYLAGRKDGYVTDERLAGINQLKKELKFKLNIQYADFSEKKARELTLQYGEQASAVVCASDLMAIGAVNALKEMNIFRPCCGYDGITLMGYVGKEMMTCRQDFFHVSQTAIDEALRLLSGEVGRSVLLNYEILRIKYEDVIM